MLVHHCRLLVQRMPDRRIIADGIYNDEENIISQKDELDPRELQEFKNRALSLAKRNSMVFSRISIF